MSPAEYGAASMLTVSALLLTTLFAAPLEQLVFRLAARGGVGATAQLRAVGIYIYVMLPVAMAVAAIVCALWLPPIFGIAGSIWAIEIAAVGFMATATYFALPLVRARQDLRKFAALSLTSITAIATGKILLVIVLDYGVTGWAVSDLAGGVATTVVAVALVRIPKGRVGREAVASATRFALPLIPHRAAFWSLSSLSRPALGVVSTLAQVGILSFGLNLASVANLVLAEINRAVLPHYSRETFPAPTRETARATRVQFVLAFAVPAALAGALAAVGPVIIDRAFWPAFAPAALLLVGQVAYGLYLLPMNYTVQTAGKTSLSSLASAVGAFVILIAILVFGSRFGAMGVAVATAVGFSLMAVMAFGLTRVLRLKIRWRDSLPPRWTWCVGIAGVCAGVAALLSTPQSPQAYGAGLIAVTTTITFAWLALREHRTDS